MKKIYLFILALITLAACSNDDFTDVSPQGNDDLTTRSTADKIFTLKPITSAFFTSGYTQNYMCTDSDGNLYFIEESSYNTVLIKKYDPQTDQISTYITLPTDVDWMYIHHAICMDNQKNIYYTNGRRLIKIVADNGGIVDMTSRFAIQSGYYVFFGLCAADNGNVFVTLDDGYSLPETGYWKQQQKLLKIAANGKVSEIIDNIEEENFYFKGGGVVKPNGAFVYVVEGWGNARKYVKASTTNGTYESFTAHNDVQAVTAALTKANPYALSGYDIIQLRPNAASDLVVGTIPNYMPDGQGGFLELAKPTYFCVNPDATVFYVIATTKNNYYTTNLYKVTLD